MLVPNGSKDKDKISSLLSGKTAEYVVTHPGRSQYSQAGGGVSACGLAALNCARIVLGLHSTGLGSAQLVEELMKRKFLEDILHPCLSWSTSAHLSVEEIYKAPIFQQSVELLSSDYGQASLPYFEKLIKKIAEYTKQHSASTCVIITRPPEIIACFCLSDVPAELFFIFDSHPRPDKHPNGAAFIFTNSVRSTAEYLANLLRYDEHLLSDSTVQWQAQLLAHCSGDIFVARRNGFTSSQWAQLALDASLQVLRLQARVLSLEKEKENLESDKQRLNDEVSSLEDKVLEREEEVEKLKVGYERSQSSTQTQRNESRSSRSSPTKPSKAPRGFLGVLLGWGDAPVPKSSITTRPSVQDKQKLVFDASDYDVADALAIQMQQAFDDEDKQLERQPTELKDIQPTFFDCGICFESYQGDHLAWEMSCGHSYCLPCLRAFAVSKIEDHRFPIICPTCQADKDRSVHGELDEVAILQLGLDQKHYEIYTEMQMSRFSTVIHCRKCSNTIFVDKAEYQEAKEIVCPLRGCGYVWCKLCSQAIEIGGVKHSCDGTSELNRLMDQRGWKHCPGCQTPAEKIDGCNHMTCMAPGCNAHFCYLCGALIVQSVSANEISGAVTSHYRRCTLFRDY